jgi:two-component system, NarL family, response regulator LiaR
MTVFWQQRQPILQRLPFLSIDQIQTAHFYGDQKIRLTMVSVCIIEDNLTYRNALLTYLQKAGDVTVGCTGSSLADLPQLIKAAPDVVIMDINLGHDSGIDGVRQVKEALPNVKILMLTVFEEEEKIFNSLKAGAIGYLLKKDPPEKILEAIRSAHRGEGVINGQVARKILSYFQQPVKTAPNLDSYNLTKREQEILLLLMDGLSYKEIAAKCFISIDTINSHIRKIYTKLNVRSRAEIAARFRR